MKYNIGTILSGEVSDYEVINYDTTHYTLGVGEIRFKSNIETVEGIQWKKIQFPKSNNFKSLYKKLNEYN